MPKSHSGARRTSAPARHAPRPFLPSCTPRVSLGTTPAALPRAASPPRAPPATGRRRRDDLGRALKEKIANAVSRSTGTPTKTPPRGGRANDPGARSPPPVRWRYHLRHRAAAPLPAPRRRPAEPRGARRFRPALRDARRRRSGARGGEPDGRSTRNRRRKRVERRAVGFVPARVRAALPSDGSPSRGEIHLVVDGAAPPRGTPPPPSATSAACWRTRERSFTREPPTSRPPGRRRRP